MRILRRRGDRGSIAISMMVMTAGVGLSAVMVTSSMQIISGARAEQSRASALQAARAGLTNALTTIRSSVDTEGLGSIAKLPCASYLDTSTRTFAPQVAGTIGSPGLSASRNPGYKVSITYLTADPTGQSAAWISLNGNPCASSLGSLPTYAYLSSTGLDPVRNVNRTVYGVYPFVTVLNANTSGGQIHAYRTSGINPDLCLDGGAMTAGARLTVQVCNAAIPARQTFAYQPGLEITLDTGSGTLCVTAGSPQAAKNYLTLQACATTAVTAVPQRWSYNSTQGFLGASTSGTTVTTNGFCWSVVSPNTPNSYVWLNDNAGTANATKCNAGTVNNVQSFVLNSAVGAGGAGQLIPKSQINGLDLHASQLINYAEFSQCLAYVSGGTVTKLNQCKQSPTLDLAGNYDQSFAWPKDGATGPIFAYDNPRSVFTCLTLPTAGATPATVTMSACRNPLDPTTLTPNQIWWSRGASTTAANLRYRLEGVGDWTDQCLAVVTDSGGAKTIQLAACNTTAAQKWNAVATASPAGLSAIGEK